MASGTNKYYEWDYSKSSDILNIHKIGKKTCGSAELGDFTIDFDKEGNVVGVEVLNASEFFSDMGINTLSDLQDAEMRVNQRNPNVKIAMITITFAGKEPQTFPIPCPITPVCA